MAADEYEPVAFVSVEGGDDLIVSFYVTELDDPSGGRSVTLLRTVKWEHLVPDWERGVTVYDEGFPEGEGYGDNFLERIRLTNSTVQIESTHYKCKLDLRRVEKSELIAVMRTLKRMNFDKRFKLELA